LTINPIPGATGGKGDKGDTYFNLSSTNPNMWGHMSIDFSKLEAGGVYQNDTFVAGALFGIVVPGTSDSSGSGTGIVTASIPILNKDSGDALTVDGRTKGEKQINGKDVIAVSPGNFVTVIPNMDSFAAIGVIMTDL
jgi:hypothetical protein